MKKVLLYLLLLLGVAVVTIGVTYAFFSSTTRINNKNIGKTNKLEVLYSGDTAISGSLKIVKDKSGGFRRQISIGLEEDSVNAKANIYIAIDEITSTIATNSLKWEIYKIENGIESQTAIKKGSFDECANLGETPYVCTNGSRIYMQSGLTLSTDPQQFAIYIWLDGANVGNEVIGAKLNAYIGAETENITGILQ